MTKWSSEFTVPAEAGGVTSVKFEDGGQAAIMYDPVEDHPPETGGDGCFFVRLHSWDESAFDPALGGYPHRVFRSFMGKRVRVTVEVLDTPTGEV